MSDHRKNRYMEAARRLFAAYVSWHDGISPEQAYKQYATSSAEIGTYWLDLAERIDRDMVASRLKAVERRKSQSS